LPQSSTTACAIERCGQSRKQELHVLPVELLFHGQLRRDRREPLLPQQQNLLLDLMLFGIGQLESAMAEDFQPVIRYGLCDAEIITPAVNGPVRVRYATPGV